MVTMRRSRFFGFGLFAAIAVSISLLFGGCGKSEKKGISADSGEFGVIDEAYDVITEHAVYPLKKEDLIEGALRGMADVIGDPYSTYLTKEEAASHKESLAGERVGIGAEITRTNGKFVIVSPVKGSPSEKAGLLPYDELVQIDSERVDGLTLQEVVKRIRGKKGTSVKLTVYRPEAGKHIELTIERDVIPVHTVTSEILEERGRKIGYIGLTMFGEDSAKEWQAATDLLVKEGAEAILIDVRGNPGGYLHAVGAIAGSVLPEDTVFAYMENIKGQLTPLVTEKPEGIEYDPQLKKLPVVLMQDQGSASASEVLSGALQDLGRGFIVGTTSFGKGTVQETMELSNGGEVKLSTHKWLTPKERWIHGEGVESDLKVKQNSLFAEHLRVLADTYAEEQFNDDIAYAQRILKALDYEPGRVDGYFDDATKKAVAKFQKDEEQKSSGKMDAAFFQALKTRAEAVKGDRANDEQLAMALGYLHHALSKK
ncbi:peptidase S41 [Sporosarcina sp. NCCP-2716]|uniref:S41 family peptidase n=1 Tax=Sporosarcina sp. NCCP-2716 TaxID=2943679 RepID=UPI00203ED7C9|nr:S41 family peptidase [Sporosarcina sp. NCCP-2716]GKV67550.1 peptidase S41 [Sporosarcina sp. NCCP-2716]